MTIFKVSVTSVDTREQYKAYEITKPFSSTRPIHFHGFDSAVGRRPLEDNNALISVLQNICLRSITGAYKATNIRALEAESGVIPLGIHLDRALSKSREARRCNEVIATAEAKIRSRLKPRRGGNPSYKSLQCRQKTCGLIKPWINYAKKQKRRKLRGRHSRHRVG